MASAGSSRLERLLALLHTGGSEATRAAAARQLGQIQQVHPTQLHTLLRSVLPYLFNEEWQTRRAAAMALEMIAAAVPAWRPAHIDQPDEEAEAAARLEAEGAWLAFGSFDMSRVLKHGTVLLASGGQEFELAADARERPRERLLRQRAILQEQLGLGGSMGRAMGTDAKEMAVSLVSERDLESAATIHPRSQSGGDGSAEDPAYTEAAQSVMAQLSSSGGELSVRARNTLKRQAKQAAALSCGGLVTISTGGPSDAKRARTHAPNHTTGEAGLVETMAAVEELGGQGEAEGDEDGTGWEASSMWPFEPLCAELRCSLFHARWPRRHGAGLGLIAIFRAHASTAGTIGGIGIDLADELRAQWRQDCAIRLLCVLGLDRFGDWASGDRVTAPVRETAGQALAVLIRAMTPHGARDVAMALLTMAAERWEALCPFHDPLCARTFPPARAHFDHHPLRTARVLLSARGHRLSQRAGYGKCAIRA